MEFPEQPAIAIVNLNLMAALLSTMFTDIYGLQLENLNLIYIIPGAVSWPE